MIRRRLAKLLRPFVEKYDPPADAIARAGAIIDTYMSDPFGAPQSKSRIAIMLNCSRSDCPSALDCATIGVCMARATRGKAAFGLATEVKPVPPTLVHSVSAKQHPLCNLSFGRGVCNCALMAPGIKTRKRKPDGPEAA